MTSFSKGAAMIAAFVIGMTCMSAAPAQAQTCGATGQGSNMSYTNVFRYQGSTTRGNCTAGISVEDWFGSPIEYQCSTNDVGDSGHCRDISASSGNAVVTVYVRGCGSVAAYRNHSWVISGEWWWSGSDVGPITVTTGCSTEPPPACDPAYYYDYQTEQCEWLSPIILSLGKSQRFELTDALRGVNFDLNNDGIPERISWTAPGADLAFLAMDRDGDGMITNGSELFGNFTVPGLGDGFLALKHLADLETGGDSPNLSAEHPLAAKLVLWTDTNHDGISQPSEMVPLVSRVTTIGFDYRVVSRKDGFGNTFRYKGWAEIRTAPGQNNSKNLKELKERARDIYDVGFVSLR